MVLGLTRPRPRTASPIIRPLEHPDPASLLARAWHAERGEILFETACDVVGGFPGFAETGGQLTGTRLRITEHYLLVGDGTARGFGLPIQQLDGSAFLPVSNDEDYALRLFYRDGFTPRVFTLRFQGLRKPSRGGLRAERAQLSLLRAGFADRFADAPPAPPDFAVSWEETESFEFENVLWRGEAIVPLAVGLTGTPGSVWLTTRSLIWSGETARGIFRIPLVLLTGVAAATIANREGTPALYAGVGDETTGRFDLPFIFDRYETADQNLRERGALLVGLRSRGLPIEHPVPLRQPWRDMDIAINQPLLTAVPFTPEDSLVYDDGTDGFPVNPIDDLPEPLALHQPMPVLELVAEDDEEVTEDVDYPEWPTPRRNLPALIWEVEPAEAAAEDAPAPEQIDIVLAEWSADTEEAIEQSNDLPLAAGWLSTDEPNDANGEPAVSTEPITAVESVAALSETLPATAAYIAAAESAIELFRRAISHRAAGEQTPMTATLPSTADQAAAIAELTQAHGQGDLSAEVLSSRSTYLLALGDSCNRLQSLIDVHDRGLITTADLERRHQSLVSQLDTMKATFVIG